MSDGRKCGDDVVLSDLDGLTGPDWFLSKDDNTFRDGAYQNMYSTLLTYAGAHSMGRRTPCALECCIEKLEACFMGRGLPRQPLRSFSPSLDPAYRDVAHADMTDPHNSWSSAE